MDKPHLSEEDVARLVGRLVLNHELELRRQETVLTVKMRQLQGELEAAQAELGRLRVSIA